MSKKNVRWYKKKIKIGEKMDIIVRISKEKKEKDFRMVVIPSGRDEIGIIQTKDYGIIAYPDKKDFEKIGEMINQAFNESDDKVIENTSDIKIEKQFYNCSSSLKVTKKIPSFFNNDILYIPLKNSNHISLYSLVTFLYELQL